MNDMADNIFDLPTSIQSPDKKPIVENGLIGLDKLDQIGTETLLAMISSKTNQEAAEKLGISYQALWARNVKYDIDKIVAQIPKQALLRLQIGSNRAADKLVEKLDDRREGLQAATEILDRVGLTGDKGNTVNIENKVLVIPSELMFKYGITSDAKAGSTG